MPRPLDNERHREDHDHDHDRGLAFDLTALVERRRVLKLLGGAGLGLGLAGIAACADETAPGTSQAASSTTAASSAGSASSTATASSAGSGAASTESSAASDSCEVIPEETAGPFPGDGSNGPNVLTESGVVRRDITSSFGAASGVASGVPLEIIMTIQEAATGCAPLSGAAVYVWHCDAGGSYSLYSDAAADENYLRGVQETDAGGQVGFTSIYPGCYTGRWPHVHFEVYPSLEQATSAAGTIATSQLALPQDISELVYATDGYAGSTGNLAGLSLSADNVFGEDGGRLQLATVSGDADSGFVAELVVTV